MNYISKVILKFKMLSKSCSTGPGNDKKAKLGPVDSSTGPGNDKKAKLGPVDSSTTVIKHVIKKIQVLRTVSRSKVFEARKIVARD